MTRVDPITAPDQDGFAALCAELASWAPELEQPGAWPGRQLARCGEYGVWQWFFEPQWMGQGWSELDLIRGYLRLATACLTTTFVITQWNGACRRIAGSENETVKRLLLPDLTTGRKFATVGISHLTTSRQHVARPVLRATQAAGGFVLDGFSPWVTGAPRADVVVIGATLEDGRQILVALPTDLPGVSIPPPLTLIGLNASQTGAVHCDQVFASHEWLLAGPLENVMRQGVGANTGGLQTSTLALGLSAAALAQLEDEATRRTDLRGPAGAMRGEWQSLHHDLMRAAVGDPVCTNDVLRTRANSLALRTTQALLAAAKGTGYVVGHPAGRWCREALFFLVWSCPQPVVTANLCELAGIQDTL